MDRTGACFILMIFTMAVIMVYIVKSTKVPDILNKPIVSFEQRRSAKRSPAYSVNGKTKRRLPINSTLLYSDYLIRKISNNADWRVHSTNPRETTKTNKIQPHLPIIQMRKNMEALTNKGDMDQTKNTTPTIERLYESTLKESQRTTYCSFSFDDIFHVKQQLDELKLQPVFLFYVRLMFKNQNFSMRQNDELLHWQFVLWKEKSLISLPVDFDVVTLNSISSRRESLLTLPISDNNSNCTTDFSYALQSVRFLLWSELFANDSRYYLCHRNHEDVTLRTILYAITNVWIGYNFNCSTADTMERIEEQNIINYWFTIFIQVFCFFLSLQFVWILVFLDISYKNKQHFDGKYEAVYTKNERPYGHKQFFFKLFIMKHFKQTTNSFNILCFKIYSKFLSSEPSRKLIILLVFCNMFIAIYRTAGRYEWALRVSGDPLNVFRPSESFFYLIYKCTNFSLDVILIFDVIYAALFPLGFVYFGSKLYQEYLSYGTNLCPLYFSSNDREKNALTRNKSLSDSFIFPWYVLRAHRNNVFMKLLLILSCCFPICPFSCNALDVFAFRCRNRKVLKNKYFRCVCRPVAFVLLYLLFLRPIIATFTFIFRAFTYTVFVALPINTDIMRVIVLLITTSLYFFKFINEISNMYSEILEYIFQIKEYEVKEQTKVLTVNRGMESKSTFETDFVSEAMFDAICRKLFFTKKKLYFVFFKLIVIFVYLLIVLQILDDDQLALSGYDIKDIIEVTLASIGPYAISFFLKGNNENFLSDENKLEIKREYDRYRTQSTTAINEQSSEMNFEDSDHCLDDLSERMNLIRTETRSYTETNF